MNAWTSPARTSSEASISARVPGNVFDSPVMRSAGSSTSTVGGSSRDPVCEGLIAASDPGAGAADLGEVTGGVGPALAPAQLEQEVRDLPAVGGAPQPVAVATHE